jgi:hypothetical protein
VTCTNLSESKDFRSGTNLLLSYYNHAIGTASKQQQPTLKPEQVSIIQTLMEEVIALIDTTL